jgi:hypothetical protein
MSIAEWKGRALTDVKRHRWFYLMIFALLGAGWMMRFEVVAAHGMSSIVISRFSGAVYEVDADYGWDRLEGPGADPYSARVTTIK